MSNRLIAVLMKQTQHLVRPCQSVPDAVLLERFTAEKDHTAFTTLVRRHGPMIWAVCRNLLRAESDAEDAFQAVFLALLQNGKRIRQQGALGAWLHQVATRICLKARQRAASRARLHAKIAAGDQETSQNETWYDELTQVHKWINRLPPSEYEVFVLCVLEGIPQAEAAQRLHLKLGSVSGLVSRARRRLQSFRGQKSGSSLLALSIVASVPASVPAALFSQACSLARSTTGVSAGILSLTASLTEVSMRKSVIVLLMAVSIGSGVTFGTFFLGSTDAQESPDKQATSSLAIARLPPQDPNVSFTSARTVSSPLQKWEYKTIRRSNVPADPEFNGLGEDGWELCATSVNPVSNQLVFVFKRPKSSVALTYSENKFGRTETTSADSSAGAREYHVFRLEHAKAEEAVEILRKIFNLGTIASDPRTNTLHVQCPKEILADVEKLLKTLEDAKPARGGL
jgi:RNA polymerase sigma factor (sigma-70 family)